MNILVTGASSGIGKTIYDHYKGFEDADVTGMSRHGPDIPCDFSKKGVGYLAAKYGKWDVAILNHGVMNFNEDASNKETYDTNFNSYWGFLQACEFLMGKTIIINASLAGVHGDPNLPYYAAQKAALLNLTKSYAKKYVLNNTRVNAFSCGFFPTKLIGSEQPLPQHLIETIPMGREGRLEEIIPVIDMLINCTYITGQNIIVDGGIDVAGRQ